MDHNTIARICENIENREDSEVFTSKSYFDTLGSPTAIIGREEKAEELIRSLLAYKKGYVVPLVSVYGKSGSGKSAVVKFVCESLQEQDHIWYIFVNLRKARTVFGCANVILGELGESTIHSAQGTTVAVEKIFSAIEARLAEEGEAGKKRLFVIVLDEFDILFQDRRGMPSDFIYDLLLVQEKVIERGQQMCIVAISNNVLAEYELDDKIRSRIGNSEIFFAPYAEKELGDILRDRAANAFQVVDDVVIKYCAKQSSNEHGDARRAVELLRVAAEIAAAKKEKLAKSHVEEAWKKLESERVNIVLSASPRQLKLACLSLVRIEYLTGQGWHSTSTLYHQYIDMTQYEEGTVSYRRFSQLLKEVVNMGLAVFRTGSKGRYGYGTEYKLNVSPYTVGRNCDTDRFHEWEKEKRANEQRLREDRYNKIVSRGGRSPSTYERAEKMQNAELMDERWDRFVGLKE